jgi:hypothetical protein
MLQSEGAFDATKKKSIEVYALAPKLHIQKGGLDIYFIYEIFCHNEYEMTKFRCLRAVALTRSL